jgi:hypothetical protein
MHDRKTAFAASEGKSAGATAFTIQAVAISVLARSTAT